MSNQAPRKKAKRKKSNMKQSWSLFFQDISKLLAEGLLSTAKQVHTIGDKARKAQTIAPLDMANFLNDLTKVS